MPNNPLQTLNDLRAERVTVTASVPFFELRGTATDLCPVGTVAVIAGLANSDLITKVEAALVANDTKALNAALAEARANEGEQAAIVSEQQAVEKLESQPAFADIRFLTKTLVSNVFVTPEVDFVRYFFPFAGGRLETQDFLAAYFVENENAPKFKIIIVVHAPELTSEQASLVSSVPTASREMLVSEGPMALLTTTILATMGAAAVAAGIGYAVGRVTQHVMQPASAEIERKILEKQADTSTSLKNLTPTSAVQKLIAAKREALAIIANS